MKKQVLAIISILVLTAVMLFSCAPRAAINARNDAEKTSTVAKQNAEEQREAMRAADEKKAKMGEEVENLKQEESSFDRQQGFEPSDQSVANAGETSTHSVTGLKSLEEAEKIFESGDTLVFEY